MTLTDDLHDTAAALQAGWPIENINRARRVRAEQEIHLTRQSLPKLHASITGSGSFDFTKDDAEIAIELGKLSADSTDAEISDAICARGVEVVENEPSYSIRIDGVDEAHIALVRAALEEMNQ